MSPRAKSKLVLSLATMALVSGCADYLNNQDSVSFRAGNAQEANTAIQATSPWPPNVQNINIPTGY